MPFCTTWLVVLLPHSLLHHEQSRAVPASGWLRQSTACLTSKTHLGLKTVDCMSSASLSSIFNIPHCAISVQQNHQEQDHSPQSISLLHPLSSSRALEMSSKTLACAVMLLACLSLAGEEGCSYRSG